MRGAAPLSAAEAADFASRAIRLAEEALRARARSRGAAHNHTNAGRNYTEHHEMPGRINSTAFAVAVSAYTRHEMLNVSQLGADPSLAEAEAYLELLLRLHKEERAARKVIRARVRGGGTRRTKGGPRGGQLQPRPRRRLRPRPRL